MKPRSKDHTSGLLFILTYFLDGLICCRYFLFDDHFPCLSVAHANDIDTLLEHICLVATQRVDADGGGSLMAEFGERVNGREETVDVLHHFTNLGDTERCKPVSLLTIIAIPAVP